MYLLQSVTHHTYRGSRHARVASCCLPLLPAQHEQENLPKIQSSAVMDGAGTGKASVSHIKNVWHVKPSLQASVMAGSHPQSTTSNPHHCLADWLTYLSIDASMITCSNTSIGMSFGNASPNTNTDTNTHSPHTRSQLEGQVL
jgi:hypothetical protein